MKLNYNFCKRTCYGIGFLLYFISAAQRGEINSAIMMIIFLILMLDD